MATLTLKGITFNLSRTLDTERLMSLANKPHQNQQEVKNWYNERVEKAFENGRLYKEEADFYCLQEFYPNDPQKKGFVQILLNAGFSILDNGGDLGIAYKTNQFILEKSAYTSSGTNGALYALLKHKDSGETICVVTDHARGFDARLQKTLTRASKLGAPNNPNTERWEGPALGDRNIANSLMALNKEFSPNLFVVGLDANTTAGYLEKNRVHPKRMDQFFQDGWVCDEKDIHPTLIDHCLEPEYMQKERIPSYTDLGRTTLANPQIPVKYDYVCAKTPWGHELEITSRALGPEPDKFGEIISDHRPVLATIEIKTTWTSRLWSLYKFFRLFSLVSLVRNFLSSLWPRQENRLEINLEPFDKHFEADQNYSYLKANSNYLGLLVVAGITPDELGSYFQVLPNSLAQLLEMKNKKFSDQDNPAQICEFFIVSCVLKKLDIKHALFKTFPTYPMHLITELKQGLKSLLKKKTLTLQETKIRQYFQREMEEAFLMTALANDH